MRRRLLGRFLLFALALVVVTEVPLGLSLARNERVSSISELQRDASSLAVVVAAGLRPGNGSSLKLAIRRFARADSAVVAVVSAGHVDAAAGSGALEELRDPRTKAIIKAAGAGQTSGEEGSRDPDDDFLYVALPVAHSVAGASVSSSTKAGDVVLLVAESTAQLHARIRSHWINLALFGAGMLVVATAAGTLVARSLTRPLEGIEAAVAAVGAGRLSERAPVGRGPAELKALGETVNEMADRLEELVHTQRAFLADASHQLRTPLTALRLRLENLDETLAVDQRADLAPALAEADRLSRIVDGLLTLARTEGTRPTGTDRRRCCVARPGGGMGRPRRRAWGRPRARGAILRFFTTFNSESVCLPGSRRTDHRQPACERVLEATPAGGRVSIGAVRVGDRVEIHVVDNGPGMTIPDMASAFDRFWRREGAPHGGSGLGLAIVAQLARMSGGAAELGAVPGGGIDAVVRLEAAYR